MQREDDGFDSSAGKYKFGLSRFRAAQLQFLLSIERHVPKVLEALRDSVLPVWCRAQRKGQQYPQLDPATYPAIWEWAKDYNLIEANDVRRLKKICPNVLTSLDGGHYALDPGMVSKV